MTRRRAVIVVLVAFAVLVGPTAAPAQSKRRIPRVGVLVSGKPPTRPTLEALRQGLRELGYVEGQSIVLELKWDEERSDPWLMLAEELVRSNVDVIVATGQSVPAAQQATRDIPIVMATGFNPVERGWVTSLARPGGNVTGVALMTTGLSAKRVELLREIVPHLRRVGIVWTVTGRLAEDYRKETEATARALGIEPLIIPVRGSADLEGAFRSAMKGGAGAMVFTQAPLFSTHRAQIGAMALKHRMPTIAGETGFAEAGGLMEFGPSLPDNWRRAAHYVDRVLKGAKPGDLPIEQPTKFELVVNAKTAATLGLRLPPAIKARADRVIE
jgi:putative ABC transport system substrate-binding protein